MADVSDMTDTQLLYWLDANMGKLPQILAAFYDSKQAIQNNTMIHEMWPEARYGSFRAALRNVALTDSLFAGNVVVRNDDAAGAIISRHEKENF